MALLLLYLIGCITVFIFGVTPGRISSNFPLDDCTTSNMDILTLLIKEDGLRFSDFQESLHSSFIRHVAFSPYNMTIPRVKCAQVNDGFYNQFIPVNISDWQFDTCFNSSIYSTNHGTSMDQEMKTVQEVLKAKITFVGLLFSDMSGVSKNATKVALMYMDCTGYSLEDARNLPSIVQQQNTEVKIFLVVFGITNLKETIHLIDTLLPHCDTVPIENVLAMAMCKQCKQGWLLFEHNNSMDFISCYYLSDNTTTESDWIEGLSSCETHKGVLAGIESREELLFLQMWFKQYFTERLSRDAIIHEDGHYLAQVYIGLRRNLESVTKRFHWYRGKVAKNRPLVVNNWMRGQPSGGFNVAACGAWQFVWYVLKNDTNISNKGGGYVDGWVDIGCRAQLRMQSLCEVILPSRLEDMSLIRINLASKDSFTKTLSRTNCKKFGDNIVSASVHITTINELKLPNEFGSQFPIFDCGDVDGFPRYISYVYVCDTINHCSNMRDETFCSVESVDYECTFMPTFFYPIKVPCSGVYCCDGSCLLLQQLNDGEIDCTICKNETESVTTDETGVLNMYLRRNMTCAFICDDDTCVTVSELSDGIKSCYDANGQFDETFGKLELADTCYNIIGEKIWAPRCVYVRDRFGAIMGCRDVSHLKDCMDFECTEGYTKCLNSYCIPQHYVLDGNIDCPTGEEELSSTIDSCAGNFKCWNSNMCLHPDLVCDSHPDCPQRDDEMDCTNKCKDGFQCVSDTITISNYNRSIPLTSITVGFIFPKYVDFSGVDLSKLFRVLIPILKRTVVIIMSNCKIQFVYIILNYSPLNVQKLDISYNLIQAFSLSDADYHILHNIRHLNLSYNEVLVLIDNLRFKYLEILDLSHTGLSYIDNSFCKGLPSLKHFNLSYTSISDLSNNLFSSNLNLQALDLRGMPLENFFEDFFNGLIIEKHLYTDNFQLCCPQIRGQNISHYTCHSPDDSMSSCFDLLKVHVQRILLWVAAVFAVLGNIAVIVYRAIWDTSVVEAGYGLFVINLGISDIIMGVYLFIIAGADYYYRGVYILYDTNWKESIVCQAAGFLATFSTETSNSIICCITVDRLLVMKFPFGQIQFSKLSRAIALLVSWIMGFLLALIPVVFRYKIYSSNAMCLGLPLTTKRVTGWGYSFSVFIVYNFALFLFIAYGQIVIYRSMSHNRISRSSSSTVSRRPQDIMVAKQLSLVALTNFLCWFPIGVMGLLILAENEVNSDIYAWAMVTVLPINSAVNPLLYTIPAILAWWEKYKCGGTRTHRTPA